MSIRISTCALRVFAWAGLVILSIQAPQGRAATIRQLVEVVDINNISVSPGGEWVAFRTEQASIERNTYDTVWYVQPVDGTSPPRRLGDGGEMLPDGGGSSVPEPVVWSTDGKWIFFRAVHGGRIDLWRAAIDGSRTEQLTHDAANVRSFVLSSDGATIEYSVGADRLTVRDAEISEYDNGFHIDERISLADNLFRSGMHEGRLATQHLKNSVEYVPLLSEVPDRWKSLDIATRTTVELSGDHHDHAAVEASNPPEAFRDAAQVVEDRSTARIAVVSEDTHGERSAQASSVLGMLPDRKSRRAVQCQAEACRGKRISGIAWRPHSDEVLFTVSEQGSDLEQSVLRWNVVSGDVTPVVSSRGQLTGGGRWWPSPCAVAASALLCVAADADAPPRLERIDMDSGSRAVLFSPNQTLALDMKQAAHVQSLAWTDREGNRFTGKFYPAPSQEGKPPPLFVVYYRCTGFVRGSVGDEWPLATFARSGIAALCINAAPYENDALVRYQQGLTAVESAVKLLAGEGKIDPARVGMGGLSMGGEVTLWTAMHSDLLRAISVSTPVMSPNMSLMMSLGGTAHFDRIRRFWQLGTPEETPQRWAALSPTADVERLRAPALMQMSEQEYRYSLDYTVPLIRKRRADVYVFPNEPHQKFQPRHKLAVYQRNLEWFNFWLLGKEDPDRAKEEQYAVWRQMSRSLPEAKH